MRGFLIRYYERKTTAEEADGWVAYVLNHKLKCVEKLGEEMLFWRFVLEREIFSAEDVRTYVDLVTALECRAFLFKYLNEGDCVYFVHSYYGAECDESVIATTEYGAPLTAAVASGNVCGCQFHPEKSGSAGLSILKAFCEL